MACRHTAGISVKPGKPADDPKPGKETGVRFLNYLCAERSYLQCIMHLLAGPGKNINMKREMMNPVYLDYNATTPVDKDVADFMIPFLRERFGNPSSDHWYGAQTRKAVEEAREQVARLLGCKPTEVIFTSGGTESNNLAITGTAYALKNKGNHIITTKIEHPAVMEVCRKLEREGFEVTWLDVDELGRVNPGDVARSIRPSTILVSVMHANNETGTIQPVEEIAEILNERKIIFHSDAAQTAGKIEVDTGKLGVDLLSLAGHKFYGPKGVGALFIREGLTPVRLMEGANHEQNLRPGTENVLEIAGLGKAAEIAARDLEKNAAVMRRTRDLLLERILSRFPSAVRNGDPEHCLPNTLSISFPDIDASTLLPALTHVAASAGAACHADQVTVSHVLAAMHLPLSTAMGTIRLSTGKMTTEEEIAIAADEICTVALSLSPSGPSAAEQVAGGPVRLTTFTHGLGCACKISPRILAEVLRAMPVPDHPDVLVSAGSSDDAAVYRISPGQAIVQTVDFFTPVIDDPYQFGAVAAANALSDIYAMGATPLFALNIVAFPNLRLPISVLRQILDGANEVAAEAGIFVLGGHTIEDNEPKFGMVVTGTVHPDKILKNSGARPGDDLILTKPIGTGVLSTALKRGLLDGKTEETLFQSMRTLNKKAADLMQTYPVHACTDITGFGLLGHLREMCEASETGAEIFAGIVPLLDKAYELAAQGIVPGGTRNNIGWLEESLEWHELTPQPLRILLADAQTSGGLLLSVPPDISAAALETLRSGGVPQAAIIGKMTPMQKHALIRISR